MHKNTPPTLTIREDNARIGRHRQTGDLWQWAFSLPAFSVPPGCTSPWMVSAGRDHRPRSRFSTNINNYRQHSSIAYGAGRFVLTSDSGRIFSSRISLPGQHRRRHHTQLITVKYLDNTFMRWVTAHLPFFTGWPELGGTAHRHRRSTGIYRGYPPVNGHLVITAYNNIATPMA